MCAGQSCLVDAGVDELTRSSPNCICRRVSRCEKLKFVLIKIDNIVGERKEMLIIIIFPFLTTFSKITFYRRLDSGLCEKKMKKNVFVFPAC